MKSVNLNLNVRNIQYNVGKIINIEIIINNQLKFYQSKKNSNVLSNNIFSNR